MPYLLAGLAVALAWPVPVLLSRARWPSQAPFAALVLWQVIALAGGLSMIGALTWWGSAPVWEGLPLDPAQAFALSAAVLLTVHLLLTLAREAWRATRLRSRHRDLLAVLSTRSPEDPRLLVLDHDLPVAYCVPGLTGSVTVLSSGLLQQLGPDELRAVLAHEGAHLAQRHDLLLLAFLSWHSALPWLPTARLSLAAVRELVEILADDAALREVPRPVLLRALVAVTPGSDAGVVETGGAPKAALSSYRLSRLLAQQ
ncbi:M56 family metallopeptidase [Tessaracoccus terricola]